MVVHLSAIELKKNTYWWVFVVDKRCLNWLINYFKITSTNGAFAQVKLGRIFEINFFFIVGRWVLGYRCIFLLWKKNQLSKSCQSLYRLQMIPNNQHFISCQSLCRLQMIAKSNCPNHAKAFTGFKWFQTTNCPNHAKVFTDFKWLQKANCSNHAKAFTGFKWFQTKTSDPWKY